MQQHQQLTTTMTSQLEYKAAIALNNMAVTLLHRSCYNYALIAFQDAFTLMNVSLKNNVSKLSAAVLKSNEITISSTESSLVINQMVLDASTKLARSTTRKVSATNSNRRTYMLHPIILTSDRTSNSITDLLKLSLLTNKCYALRIDDEDTYDDYNDHVNVNDTLLEIAIILTNIGTVYRCYASTMKASSSISSSSISTRKMEKFIGVIESGMSFCNAAERVLCSIVTIQISPDDIRRQVLLNLLILHNLIKLSSENVKCNRNNENEISYQDYCFEFCDIQYRMIQQQNNTITKLSPLVRTTTNTNTTVDENNKNDNNNKNNQNVSASCFYVLNELFFITGARAA